MGDDIREALTNVLVADLEAINVQKEAREKAITLLGKAIMEETPAEKPTLEEINSLKSTEQTSNKGTYRLVTRTDNQDNPAFEKLRNYIANHNGFVTIQGITFWNFSQDPNNKIGYRTKIG